MAGKKANTNLKIALKILEFVGKPFYFLLSCLFIAFIFIFHSRRLIFFIFLSALIFSFWFFIIRGLPSPKELATRRQELSTKIYDRNGILLYKIYKNKNRTLVSLNEIPLIMQQATLSAEDAEFYNHMGISIRGIIRSFIKNIRNGELTGGSTITQQLIKNALLSPEKTLSRKVKEVILAMATELTYTKPQILEMYLNEVSYGGTAYGIEEAAQEYFGKSVRKINLAEAALLAGLPKSPTKYSPFGVSPELSFKRQLEVLQLMVINKFITQEQADSTQKEKLIFIPNATNIKAPHFVMYVKQALVDEYGEEMVQKGGLEVFTTLNYDIQTMAEKTVADEITKLTYAHVSNGAALVIDPSKGEILAMVGSKDYFDIKNDGNVNVTTALRQPGSSIKIINYAYALSHQFTPATILDDSPVSFSVPGSPVYKPVNYDGQYKGRISVRSALAQSRNIPAVKVLASYGVIKMIDLGREMGITTWDDPSRYGLSLTLGGGEVKLIDLAQVYATIANYGVKTEIKHISQITNPVQVVNSRVAYMLIDILKDNVARAPAFGINSALVIPGHPEVAVKTGTSNNFKDNLTLGFSQKYLVAVWVGNNDSTPMNHLVSGITGAAPIFNKIMSELLKEEKSIAWEIPAGLISQTTCEGKKEWFLTENSPKITCVVVKPEENNNQLLPESAHTQI